MSTTLSASPTAPPCAPITIAVASKDGISINEHFGHAKGFWIYRLEAGACRSLERREVAHYCHGQHGDQSAMAQILETIKDCHAVFVARIGDGPRDKLAAIDVVAVDDYAYEALEPSLLDYMQNLALE